MALETQPLIVNQTGGHKIVELNTPQARVENLVARVADFIISQARDSQVKRGCQLMKEKPLTVEKCRKCVELIEVTTTIIIVADREHLNPMDNTIRNVRTYKITTQDGRSIDTMKIAQYAYNELNDYIGTLTTQREWEKKGACGQCCSDPNRFQLRHKYKICIVTLLLVGAGITVYYLWRSGKL